MSEGSGSYEGFLREAVEQFWRSEASTRLDLLALLLAGREPWQVALGTAVERPRPWLKGAAGVAGATWLARRLLTGPLGVVLTGVSVGTLASVYAQHRQRIMAQARRYRALVEEFRPKFETIVEDHASGRISAEQRDLMLEGLRARFVQRLESLPHAVEGV